MVEASVRALSSTTEQVVNKRVLKENCREISADMKKVCLWLCKLLEDLSTSCG